MRCGAEERESATKRDEIPVDRAIESSKEFRFDRRRGYYAETRREAKYSSVMSVSEGHQIIYSF